MPHNKTNGETRTSDFMHALAANVNAVNITSDEHNEYTVSTWISPDDIDLASDIAHNHGFTVTTDTEPPENPDRHPPDADNRHYTQFRINT